MSARLVAAVVLCAAAAGPAAAQDEAALRSFFEGRRVVLRIDMPGTSDGVDVYVDSRRSVDYEQYRDRLQDFGTSIRTGESVTITLIKVKRDLIEFQLGGGGFGTFGDDTSTSVYMPLVEKSSRERDLESAIKDEENRHRRRDLERDLDQLRDRRERENRRIEATRAVAEEHKKEIVAERRRSGGSRFNLRYDGSVPHGITADEIVAVLAEYVDFSSLASVPFVANDGQSSSQGADAMPRKGMMLEEAIREFGPSVEASDRNEGRLVVSTRKFLSPGQEITAEFVDGVLIRFSIVSR
jgi:hypothetical protein